MLLYYPIYEYNYIIVSGTTYLYDVQAFTPSCQETLIELLTQEINRDNYEGGKPRPPLFHTNIHIAIT